MRRPEPPGPRTGSGATVSEVPWAGDCTSARSDSDDGAPLTPAAARLMLHADGEGVVSLDSVRRAELLELASAEPEQPELLLALIVQRCAPDDINEWLGRVQVESTEDLHHLR